MTLALLMGLTWITFRVATPTLTDGRLAIFLGFVLLAASVAGSMAVAVKLPRITGFIVVGIVVGPSSLGLLPSAAVAELRLIDSFALALIAMLAGGELRLEGLRPQARPILVGTLVTAAVVWVGMALVVMAMSPFVPFMAELPFAGRLAIALVLGVWAANSSPDLTVAVIEEKHAKGDIVEVVLGITIVKDVFVIVMLTLTLSLVMPLLDPAATFSTDALTGLLREVGGALVLGSAMGWIFSQYLGGNDRNPRSPLATFLFAYVMVVLAEELHVELLLTGVAAGFVIENLSPAGDRMIQGIRAVAVVVFAFFFSIAGASLDLGAVLSFGPAAVVFLAARTWLTKLGADKGLALARARPRIRERTWLGLISQGGVTLGLILLAAERLPELAESLTAFGMVVILGNILAGPVLLGRALSEPEKEPAAES